MIATAPRPRDWLFLIPFVAYTVLAIFMLVDRDPNSGAPVVLKAAAIGRSDGRQERLRGELAQGSMGPHGVVVDAPRLDCRPCLLQGLEPVLGQAFCSEVSVEGLDERVIGGGSWTTELQTDAVAVGPGIHGPG